MGSTRPSVRSTMSTLTRSIGQRACAAPATAITLTAATISAAYLHFACMVCPVDRDKNVAHKLQTDGRHDRGYASEIKVACDNCAVQNLDHLPGEIAWLAFALAVVFGDRK